VNDKLAEPPVAVAVLVELLDPSPHVTVPLRESPAGAVQAKVAVTVWPACNFVGVALTVQPGGASVEMVIATEAGLTVAAKVVVVSVTVAPIESVGLLRAV
jgi:hypothetical protein